MSLEENSFSLRSNSANIETRPMPARSGITVEDEGDSELVTYRCNVCREHFVIIAELEQHIVNEHEGSLISKKVQEKLLGVSCLSCNQCFINVEDVNHHNLVEHKRKSSYNDKSNDSAEDVGINFTAEENKSLQGSSPDTLLSDNKDEQPVRDKATFASHSQLYGARKRRLSSEPFEALNRASKHFCNADQHLQTKQTKEDNLVIDMSKIASIKMKPNDDHSNGEVIQYIKRVEDKLDSIIKHFNVPYNASNAEKCQKQPLTQTSSTVFSKTRRLKKGFDDSNKRTPLSQEMYLDQNSMQCESPQDITNDQISSDLIKQVFLKSRNRGNFAKNLVYVVFSISERTGRNCYGRRGGTLSGHKYPLDPRKLLAVRAAVFKMFPAENLDEEEAVWKRECVIAIDTALRGEMRNRILNIKSPDNVDMNSTT